METRQHETVPAFGTIRPRGLGWYALLFGAVLVLLVIAVVLEDARLREAYETQADADARATAALLDAAFVERSMALRAFGALYAGGAGDPTAAEAGRFARILEMSSTLFDRVAVRALDGRVVHEGASPLATSEGRRMLLAMPASGAGDSAVVVPLRDSLRRVAMVVPLVADGGVVAHAIATVASEPLAREVARPNDGRRQGLVIRRGADTVAQLGVLRDGDLLAASAEAGNDWTVEVRHESVSARDRTMVWALCTLALVCLAAGVARERRQRWGVAERTAELERLSAELLRSNRMKSEFLANISHELRTPLNAIVGFVELLKDGVYGELSPRQINPVERIAGSATHLRHLVDQVLDIAKMAAGRLEVHLEAVVLRPFVLNVASELESLAADKTITLSLTISQSLPRVRTDPSHLRQILVNLIGNAIKYTPAGGMVGVRARVVGGPVNASWRTAPPGTGAPARPLTEEEGMPVVVPTRRAPDPARPWVAVQVSDTGIGIAPDDHGRIFEEFEQVNAGPRGESMQRGTGLGLPISRRLARLLGGDVTVESDLGKGATFTLWLPLDQSTPAVEERR